MTTPDARPWTKSNPTGFVNPITTVDDAVPFFGQLLKLNVAGVGLIGVGTLVGIQMNATGALLLFDGWQYQTTPNILRNGLVVTPLLPQ
jgi:hypothetical protein